MLQRTVKVWHQTLPDGQSAFTIVTLQDEIDCIMVSCINKTYSDPLPGLNPWHGWRKRTIDREKRSQWNGLTRIEPKSRHDLPHWSRHPLSSS